PFHEERLFFMMGVAASNPSNVAECAKPAGKCTGILKLIFTPTPPFADTVICVRWHGGRPTSVDVIAPLVNVPVDVTKSMYAYGFTGNASSSIHECVWSA